MSLDKAIKYGKEKRQEYRGSKSFDVTCRNHNSCAVCTDNRLYSIKRDMEKAHDMENGQR